MKKIIVSIAVLAVILIAFLLVWTFWRGGTVTDSNDYKNATYTIEGNAVTLVNGEASSPGAPGSASMAETKYFGNDATGDLNSDGVPDVGFILTQSTGGSGTFYYAVAALKTADGYTGTNAVLLGDRIAPQTTQIKDGVLVVNYADRAPGEPMTAEPSVGVSKYLEIQNGTLAEAPPVACPALAKACPDGSYVSPQGPKCEFPACPGTGQSGIKGTVSLGPTCPVEQNPPNPQCADKSYAASFTATGGGKVLPFSSASDGTFELSLPPGMYSVSPAPSAPSLPRCASVEDIAVVAGAYTNITISCDTGIR